jgi:amino acid permease
MYEQYFCDWIPEVSSHIIACVDDWSKSYSGGPAGLIYGFLIIWLGNFSVFICIGELASAVPTAGGQYHWVSLLAPRSNKKFFSYITGMRYSI